MSLSSFVLSQGRRLLLRSEYIIGLLVSCDIVHTVSAAFFRLTLAFPHISCYNEHKQQYAANSKNGRWII